MKTETHVHALSVRADNRVAAVTRGHLRSPFRPRHSSAAHRTSWSLGISRLTGVLEVAVSQSTQGNVSESPVKSARAERDKKGSDTPWLTVRISLPKW